MPLPPTPTAFKRPEHLPWKPFSRAIDLANRLNVRPSIETLKTLEMAEMEKERDAALQKDFEDIETVHEEFATLDLESVPGGSRNQGGKPSE